MFPSLPRALRNISKFIGNCFEWVLLRILGQLTLTKGYKVTSFEQPAPVLASTLAHTHITVSIPYHVYFVDSWDSARQKSHC
jgi:hypothetical protein